MNANINTACERADCWAGHGGSKPGDVFRCQHGKVYVLRQGDSLSSYRWHHLHPVLDLPDYWRARRALTAGAWGGAR